MGCEGWGDGEGEGDDEGEREGDGEGDPTLRSSLVRESYPTTAQHAAVNCSVLHFTAIYYKTAVGAPRR